MDGNRRFARREGFPTVEGHRRGYEKLKEVIRWAKEAGVSYVIVYAFSTENWNRTKEEVGYLMGLFRQVLTTEVESLKKEGVIIRCIGERERFTPTLRKLMNSAETETSAGSGPTLVLALSYGGRAEVLSAVNKALGSGELSVSEEMFKKYLWTHDIPDPDIVIRTGGEKRLSGFLPWQSVYSELFFTETLWPDFSKEEFLAIVDSFSRRKRNFGK